MGVVSGIGMSFEFGTNSSRFTSFAASVTGPLLTYEVMTGWLRSRRRHRRDGRRSGKCCRCVTSGPPGLVHSLVGTAANDSDVSQAHALRHGHEDLAFGDAGVASRDEMQGKSVIWRNGMSRSSAGR
jgi:IS5 family transposase